MEKSANARPAMKNQTLLEVSWRLMQAVQRSSQLREPSRLTVKHGVLHRCVFMGWLLISPTLRVLAALETQAPLCPSVP